MTRPSRLRRLIAGLASTALLASAPLWSQTPAQADTAPSVPTVTVRPDPSYQGPAFEGWGTSLVWFANVTGKYPDEIRDKLADLVFGKDGLGLNIARYNIGGGNAPDVPDYLRPGGAVEGWWKAPAGTTRTDTDWWNADDPQDWNPDADQTQRWWVDKIKNSITHWEAFSNSPPYFQTVSGYASGGFNSSADQIRADRVDDFAAYVTGVVQRLEAAHKIKVDTIDPLNEPNTPYWGTTLGADGNPLGGRQEGAHASPALQQEVIRALARKLSSTGLDSKISAMDETNPGTFLTDWNSYAADTRAAVDQLNVHTYGTGQRTAARDVAKGEDKPLWMSEVEGSWGNGQSFTDMDPGLGMAKHITDDLRELEPTAWVFWQPVEDYNNMKPGAESATGANWGSIQMPFNCTSADTLASCPIYTNTKFDTVRTFTLPFRPGDHLVQTNDTDSTAAVTNSGVTVVHTNETDTARQVVLDLSGFAEVGAGAKVTPVVTDADGALVQGSPVAVADSHATLTVPARSVTTFVIDDVSGVSTDAALVQPDHVYRLLGVQSGKSLAVSGNGAAIRTTDTASTDQLWKLTKVSGGTSDRARYTLTTQAGDRQLANVDGVPTLVPTQAQPDANAQHILSTTGDGTYTLVNVATRRVLEVSGQSRNDGAAVDFWYANSGANQLWTIRDETITGTAPVKTFTPVGDAPTLPTTVTGTYRSGGTVALPVTWDLPDSQTWNQPGSVTVHGTAVDASGSRVTATAVVTVDTLVSTEPGRAKTYVGGVPTLPTTVKALAKTTGDLVDRPVTWNPAPAGSYDNVGTVTLTGTADAGGGRTLPATVVVQVTASAEENVALADGANVSATFTEPGYSAAGLRNGNLTDKAWSNWRSGTKNASDTITVTLPAARTVTHVINNFYRDGGDSYAQSLQIQTRAADGTWSTAADNIPVAAGSPAPIVDVPITPTLTDAIRVVLTARPETHITMSEIQVMARTAGKGTNAKAASISVDGTTIAGFDPDTLSYNVTGSAGATVTALASDPYADVKVKQPTASDPTATVTITSEDGSATQVYRVHLVDKGALIVLVKKADALEAVDYTTTSWAALLRANAAAHDTVDDAAASQAEVDQARTALQAAIDGLKSSANPVLDTFNRADGGVGSSWSGTTGTTFYRIGSQRLHAKLGGPLVYKTGFGTSQEAFVTIANVDTTNPSQGVLLKAQTGDLPGAGAVSVVYDVKARAVRVSTVRLRAGAWTAYPAKAVTFHDGDKLTGRIRSNGQVDVLRNGTLVTTVTLNKADQTFFDTKGGKIGIWSLAASRAIFDDFGGGNLR